jgi:hypothetical protein
MKTGSEEGDAPSYGWPFLSPCMGKKRLQLAEPTNVAWVKYSFFEKFKNSILKFKKNLKLNLDMDNIEI